MRPITDHICHRLLVRLKQGFALHARKRAVAVLLALYMLCSGWALLIHRPFSTGKAAGNSPVVNTRSGLLAGELEMFEIIRPEEGAANGIITFRLLNGAVAPSDINITYVVNATVTNPAVNGVDYTTLTGSITLGTGASEVQLPIVVTDDQFIEGEENLEFTLLSATDQVGDSYLNPNRTLTTKVVDNDNRISITKVTDGEELGGGSASNGSFLLKLPGTLTFGENILVKYTIDGVSTATGGPGAGYDFDNTAVTGEIVLPANTNSISLPIVVTDDQLVEGNESVQITIQDNSLSDISAMKFTFDPAQATAAVIIIDDDDNIPINILGTTDGREPGGTANNGSFTIGWPNGITATGPVVIRYTITGTASGAADYNAITANRLLPAGTSNVTIPVTVINDAIVEGDEAVTLTLTVLTPSAGVPPLLIGPNNTATVTIADDDVMSSLQWKSAGYTGTGAGGAVTAGDQITYRIHVRNTGNVALTNVRITDPLPAHTEFISADDGITPDASGMLVWTIPAIATGSVDVVRSFTVRVANDLTGVTSILNTAYVNNGDGSGDHPTTPPDPGNPNNPHPGPNNPGDPSTDIPVDDGGKRSANWKSVTYTGTGANGTVKPGDLLTYTVHVRNTGHVRLTNVVINDNIPAYTEYVSADGGIVPDAANRLSWTITDIPVGSADVTRSFVVRVINDLTGAAGILNTAGIDNGNGSGEQPSTPPDPGNPNNPHPNPPPGDPSTNVPVDSARRSLNWKSAAYTGTGQGGAARSGDEITYTIHIRNTGYVKLENVQIEDSIPAFTEFVSADGGITPDADGKLTWLVPEIAVGGADLTRSFTVRVVNDLTNAVSIVNTAWVDNGDGSGDHPTSPPVPGNPNEPQPNPDPDDPSTEVPVDNGKNSANWKSASYTGTGEGGSVTTGDLITYTIHVRNTGNATLTNVLITDNVPAYTEFVSADDGIVPDGTGRLTWTVASIPVGAADVIRSYVARVSRDLTGAISIVNTAMVDNGTGGRPTTPPNPGDPNQPHPHPDPNDPSTNIPVDTVIGFDTWKTVVTESGNTKAKPGEILTYTIYLRNTGNVVIPTLTITDPVPEHTTFVSAADGGVLTAGAVGWTVTNLAVGATSNVTFRVRVDDNLDSVAVIINTAMVGDGNTTKPTSGCDPASTGCNGQPGTSIETMPPDEGLFFVNAMSPNGDGKNEYFTVKGLEKYPGSSLYVFNRWGSMVYQAKDYRNDWNGTGLSEGTYYYKLEIKQSEGTKLYKGWIVIKRK